MEADDERRTLIRVVRQKLQALGRAGIDRIPLPATAWPAPSAAPTTRLAGPPSVRGAVAVAPPTPPPAAPTRVPAGPPAPIPVARPSAPPLVVGSLFEEPRLAAVLPEAERTAQLALMAVEVSACDRCPHLAAARTQTVFGEGSPTARLMFVGEAPGADEDRTGRPFVGRAGALLTDMISKGMGLSREEVYIANVLKSRPPENRPPLPEEVGHCLPYLERQIAIVRPEFLCLLGKTAASALLETALPLGRLRNKWHRYREIPTIVTYHPSALLRNPAWKREAWEDLQVLMKAMGLQAPDRKKPG
jgi:uracil-DNA glycosylase family 4